LSENPEGAGDGAGDGVRWRGQLGADREGERVSEEDGEIGCSSSSLHGVAAPGGGGGRSRADWKKSRSEARESGSVAKWVMPCTTHRGSIATDSLRCIRSSVDDG
jgi:hypothetical protein